MDIFKIIYIIIILILILIIINYNKNNKNNNLIEKFSYNIDRYLKSVIYDLPSQIGTYMPVRLAMKQWGRGVTASRPWDKNINKLHDLTILNYMEGSEKQVLDLKNKFTEELWRRTGRGWNYVYDNLDSDPTGKACFQFIIDEAVSSYGNMIFYYRSSPDGSGYKQEIRCVEITPDIIYDTNIFKLNDWLDILEKKFVCTKDRCSCTSPLSRTTIPKTATTSGTPGWLSRVVDFHDKVGNYKECVCKDTEDSVGKWGTCKNYKDNNWCKDGKQNWGWTTTREGDLDAEAKKNCCECGGGVSVLKSNICELCSNTKPTEIPINLGQFINKLRKKNKHITIIFCFNINDIVNKYL